MVILITDSHKKHAGTSDLLFSEDDLYHSIGRDYSPRLHAALDLLMTKGRAKKAVTPGYWKFD
jgi:hypothetical protein